MFEWPNRAVPGTNRSILTLLFHRFPVVYRISAFHGATGKSSAAASRERAPDGRQRRELARALTQLPKQCFQAFFNASGPAHVRTRLGVAPSISATTSRVPRKACEHQRLDAAESAARLAPV